MPQRKYQYLKRRTEQGVLVLTPDGPTLRAEALAEAAAALGSARRVRVVLDLHSIRWAVGNGTRPEGEPFVPLLELRRHVQDNGGRLALCNLCDELQELLRNTWLLGLFDVQPDVAGAVAVLTR
jgi:hypothetical protein